MKKLFDYITSKFYLGVTLILLSLVVGNITKVIFVLHFGNITVRWLMIIIYIISWPVMLLGIYWAGKDYYMAMQRYFSYRFYTETVKTTARRAVEGGRRVVEEGKRARHHVRTVRDRVREVGGRVGSRVKGKIRGE